MSIGNEEVEISPEQMKKMAKEAAYAKANDADSKNDELDAKKLDDALNQVESIATDATQNEFFKENLLQKEKQMKTRKDLEKLDTQIQKAEEKLKCMETMIKREKEKADKARKLSQQKEEVQELKKEVENEVKAVKTVFHNKIDHFAVETNRIKANKLKTLASLKLRMTKMLIDQGSRGKRSNCLVDKDEAKTN